MIEGYQPIDSDVGDPPKGGSGVPQKKEWILAIPAECFSRVVGYYRPMQHWNEGKQEEFGDRNYLKVEDED